MKYFPLILTLWIICFPQTANAQANFKSGYVIKADGDTIHGEIVYRGDVLMSQVCRFRKSKQEPETKFSPHDISGYRFIEGKYYVSKEFKGKKYFLEYLVHGLVNLYFLRTEETGIYLIEKEGHDMAEIPYQEVVTRIGSTSYRQSTTNHIGLINYYMQDAPDIYPRIANIKKPDHSNLVKLAEDYHARVCNGEKCIIFEKDHPLVKCNLEIAAGFIRYHKDIEYMMDHRYFNGGILAHIWLPGENEKMFIRTGLIYSTLKYYEFHYQVLRPQQVNYYTIPFQLEYVPAKGLIRPKAAYGINIHMPFYQTVAAMGGMNVSLKGPVFLSINADLRFAPREFFLLPKEYISSSISTGLYWEL